VTGQPTFYRPLAPGLLPRLPLYLVYRADQDLTLVRNFVEVAKGVRIATTTKSPSKKPVSAR